MLDRRDLRFWGSEALRYWCVAAVGSLVLWGTLLLFLPAETRGTALDPAIYSLLLLAGTGLVSVIGVSGNVRYYLPLTLSFGTTRRSAWPASRLCYLLPIALTALLALAIGWLSGAGMSGEAIALLSALAVGWCGILDLCVMLSSGHRGWDTAAKIMTGISGGSIGAFLSFAFIGSPTGVLQELVSFDRSPALVWAVALSLAVAAVANVLSALAVRRMSVRF